MSARLTMVVRALVAALAVATALAMPAGAMASNAVATENALPGDSAWTAYSNAAPAGAIDGYSSQVSVTPGGTLQLHVSSTASYRIEISRLGWYGGAGGRRTACVPNCGGSEPGHTFGTPAPNPSTGELDAGWPVTDTVAVGSDWTTGYYLAMFVLTSGPNAGRTSWYPFIVTPPAGSHPAILVQVPVNTWQAYNPWPGPDQGGRSLYPQNSANGNKAVKVSFNRPLMTQYQGVVFGREYQGVRWLERQGYDIGYYTDVDVDQNPGELLDHSIDMVLGHDEYWTMGMRDGWDSARSTGHDLVFMGADIGTWQVRYEDSRRTLVEYRTASADPEPNPELKTMQFRNLATPMPECQLEGVQYDDHLSHPSRADYTVTGQGAANPWAQAAGLHAGDVLKDGVAYEWDAITAGCSTPPLTDLFHYSGPSGVSPADAVTFTDPSGAHVFAAGSNQLTMLLDAYNADQGQSADPRLQTFMATMFDAFLSTAPARPNARDVTVQRGPYRIHRNGCMYVRVTNHGPAGVAGTLSAFTRLRGRRVRIARATFLIGAHRSKVLCLHVRRLTRIRLRHSLHLGQHLKRGSLTLGFRERSLHATRRIIRRFLIA